jgi:hypothetical protein
VSAVDLSRVRWRKSSRSGETGDNCVELAVVDGLIAVRDSKNPTQPALIITASVWVAFADRLKGFETC